MTLADRMSLLLVSNKYFIVVDTLVCAKRADESAFLSGAAANLPVSFWTF